MILEPILSLKDPKKRTRKYSYMLLAGKFRLKDVDEGFAIFMKTLINSIELMPNFKSIMPFIQSYKLAVMSEDTSDLTFPKLKKFDLLNRFNLVITSDRIGEMKPTLSYYKAIFRDFNVEPNECVVIGDNYEKDLKIAQDMGATTIKYGKKDMRADFWINDYKDLPDILGRI